MYNSYFGLTEAPFSIAPDPRYLYLSEQHKEALAHLLYGIRNDNGFVLLTGEVGTGKTTVCRSLLDSLGPKTDLAFILNPKYSVLELLAAICDELGIPYPPGERWLKVYIDALNNHLLRSHAEGRQTVLIIDEAQNLSSDVLEQLRLLTNLETNSRKLLQIILLGQPELLDMLAKPELRQLAQRITARFHLGPLSQREMQAYVQHRLTVAGVERPLFTRRALHRLYALSQGIPRVINLLCDRALLGTYVQRRSRVGTATLKQAAKELRGHQRPPAWRPWALGALALALLAVALVLWQPRLWPSLPTASAEPKPLPAKPQQQASQEAASVPAPIVEAPPPAAPQDPWQWPEHIPLPLSQAIAFRTLFKQWHLDYKPAAQPAPCQFAKEQGLGCLIADGDWQALAAYNRPAVLQVEGEQGQSFYLTLLSIEGDKVKVLVADQQFEMPSDELRSHWQGNYSLLWRLPPGYDQPLRPGSQGLAVAWLEHQMAAINQRQERKLPEATYDFVLFRDVKAFQFKEGLAADGVVGPETSMRLTALTDGSVPLLAAPEG
ncbi:AAA family ATPase [Gallaecimonas kandeliae]|uniref:ExeA family protein n=1 Tax=Gallaecimonas kandeliae TaxID=3029055 RepID=UPI0026491789|nr:AAA family ATPase [Gallaecimonas kandeliae]WKE65656.1 AAA family ATPase [Gallaecimonas kandeliae]